MPKEFLILDGDKSFHQDAWIEQKDAKGRVTRPARPARDEVEVAVRVDRQYRAVLRFPAANMTPDKRQASIADAVDWYALGQEIASGVQVVEVEWRFNEAQLARVTPEEKDARGAVTRAESFTPAQPERTVWAFTLRLNGLHLTKTSISEAEMQAANWRDLLAQKVPSPEMFTR